MRTGLPTFNRPAVGRREFLGLGAGLAAVGLPALRAAPASAGGARSCILVYLLGGPSHIDSFDPKPDAPVEVRGEFGTIPTRLPGVRFSEHLPRLARLTHRYALVRSVSHPNHNHTPMIYYSLTGRPVERPEADNDVRPPLRTDAPHLGAMLARFRPARRGLPGYVAIPPVAVRSSTRGEFVRGRELLRGGGGGFLGPAFDPLGVDGEPGTAGAVPALAGPGDVPGDRLDRRATLLSALDGSRPAGRAHGELRDQAVALSGSAGGAADLFRLDREPPAVRDRYGRHPFGNALVLARRLAEAGVPMAAVHFNRMTVCDGWDTHGKNFVALKGELLPMLDQSVSALLEDLADRGLLERTVVAVFGEFGRTPKVNKDAGRDHWGLCQSALLAGGGIKGGQVHGSSDRIAAYPATEPVDPVDVHATMYHCLGLDPDRTVFDHLGRPGPLCTGRVIRPLV